MSCCVRALRDKEVINICDGRLLGYVCDIEADVTAGTIRALILPGDGKLFGLIRGNDLVIPWDKVQCVGADSILVRLDTPPKCK